MFNSKSKRLRGVFTTTFVVLAMLTSACGEATSEGNNTSDESRFDRPSETLDLISDDQIDHLVEGGAVIHEGDNPPDIAGVYDVDDGVVTFDDNSANIGREDVCDSIWTVEATDEPHVSITSGELYGNCSGSSEGTASYISGSGNCFSLYVASEGTREDCELKDVTIISGCMADGDIEEYINARLALERPGAECQALIDARGIPPEGDRVTVDHGLVERE